MAASQGTAPDGLSTIEAAAMVLASLEKRPDIEATLLSSFERMLAKFRDVPEDHARIGAQT